MYSYATQGKTTGELTRGCLVGGLYEGGTLQWVGPPQGRPGGGDSAWVRGEVGVGVGVMVDGKLNSTKERDHDEICFPSHGLAIDKVHPRSVFQVGLA